MKNLTIGKVRGLREIATRDDLFTILAIDQRRSLLKALSISEDDPDCYQIVRDFKLTVVEHLIEIASAALIDPEYAAAEAIVHGTLPGDKGLIVTLEKSGYVGVETSRQQTLLPDWSVSKVKAMGASAAKLYFDYHPDAGEGARQQEQLVSSLVESGREVDLPILAEPVSYSIEAHTPKKSAAFSEQRPKVVMETVRKIGALGPDLLKLEFPHDADFVNDEAVWTEACATISEISPVPWALLSAGVDFDIFRRQVKVACQSGASGFVAGRAIWKEATQVEGKERDTFMREIAAPRMAELVELVHRYGRPWTDHYHDLASLVGEGWLSEYRV
jgi:tagatose 1,6-diphosphate aldolase